MCEEKQINDEVQTRVNFKLDELLVGMRNAATRNWQIAFRLGNPKYSHYWEAFEEMVKMLEKERYMPPPFDEMYLQNKRNARDKAVNEITEIVIRRGERINDQQRIIRKIVSAVEKAQNF